MPSILFIAENLDRPERYLIKGLAERGVQVQLILDPHHETYPAAEQAGLSLVPLALRSRYDLRAIRQIRKIIREQQIDIVHCLRSNRPVSNTLIAARGLEVKIIAYRGTTGNLSRWDPASRMTYLHPRLSKVVCVSKAVEQYFLSLQVPASRLAQIYKGHDTAWYQSPAGKPTLTREGIPENAFVIGCASAMRELKGIDTLCEAMALLPADKPVHALLAGVIKDGYLKDRAADVPAPHRVHFTGFREDAMALMGACDAFVLASKRREGLPRALIEAMAQSVPPIVTNVGGMPEVVVHGQCGLMVPPEDPPALAGAIERYTRDPALCETYGRAAFARIRDHFSMEQTLEKTLAMYDEVLGNGLGFGETGPTRRPRLSEA